MTTIVDLPANVAALGTVVAIPLDRIDPDPANERGADAYLPELLGDLMQSLREQGQEEPIQVYALPDGRFLNKTGHRRCAAARALGWPTIQALIVSAPAGVVERALGRIVSNLQREDPDPLKLAESLAGILATGVDQATLAGKLGRTQPWLSNLLRLRSLPADVRELISAGKLSATHGVELLRIDQEKVDYNGVPIGRTAAAMQSAYAEESVRSGYSAKQLRAHVTSYCENQANCRRYAEENRRRAEEYATRQAEAEARRAAGQETPEEQAERERREAYAQETRRRSVAGDAARATIRDLVDSEFSIAHLQAAVAIMLEDLFQFHGSELAGLGKKKDILAELDTCADPALLHGLMARIIAFRFLHQVAWDGTFRVSHGWAWAADRWHLPKAITAAQRTALAAADLGDPPAPPAGDTP